MPISGLLGASALQSPGLSVPPSLVGHPQNRHTERPETGIAGAAPLWRMQLSKETRVVALKKNTQKTKTHPGAPGTNIMEPVSKDICSWYEGGTLFDILDSTDPFERDPLAPFRMPVIDKYKDMGTIVMGKSEAGIVRKGDRLYVMPNKCAAEGPPSHAPGLPWCELPLRSIATTRESGRERDPVCQLRCFDRHSSARRHQRCGRSPFSWSAIAFQRWGRRDRRTDRTVSPAAAGQKQRSALLGCPVAASRLRRFELACGAAAPAARVPVTVTTIYRDDAEVAAARGGENLRLRLAGIDEDDISAGFIVCDRKTPGALIGVAWRPRLPVPGRRTHRATNCLIEQLGVARRLPFLVCVAGSAS